MSDLQWLFVILALLYLWECACWIRRGSVAFRTWMARRWTVVHPGALLGNQKAGFVFTHPLPPLGTIFSGNQLPLSLSPDGALAFVAPSVNPGWRPPQNGQLLPWSELSQVQVVGKTLRLKGQTFVQTGSATFAKWLAAELRQMAQVPVSSRSRCIEELLKQTLDTAAIQQRLRLFEQQTRSLRLMTNTLFVYLFVLAPAVIWQFGLSATWPGLLAGLLACTGAAAFLFRRAHRGLYPEAEDERFTHFLIILLSPATAIRAHDLLSRPLLDNFHPLAVAKVLVPARQFEEFARNVLRELRYPAMPLCPRPDQAACATESSWRTALRSHIEKFTVQNGLNPDELLEGPKQADSSCRSYCPRCGAQYTTPDGICADCGGLALVAFPQEVRQLDRAATENVPAGSRPDRFKSTNEPHKHQ